MKSEAGCAENIKARVKLPDHSLHNMVLQNTGARNLNHCFQEAIVTDQWCNFFAKPSVRFGVNISDAL